MKRSITLLALLPLLAFSTGKTLAQSTNNANINTELVTVEENDNVIPAMDPATITPNTLGISDTTVEAKNDPSPVIANVSVFPNPSNGIITIKTECTGKLYFYSQKGKEKGVCIVNEGSNLIYLSKVLLPGAYICKFEGANGSVAQVRVVYQL